MRLYAEYPYASVSMSKDVDFINALQDVFKRYKIHHIIESGTYLGTGSTTLLANTITSLNLVSSIRSFYTIEVDYYLYAKAKKNLRKYSFITPVWGMSVTKAEALAFIQADDLLKKHETVKDIFIDDINDPVGFYTSEINGELSNIDGSEKKKYQKLRHWRKLFATFKEGILAQRIPSIKNEHPLFLLDSAGGIGWLEFQKVVQLMGNSEYVIILDDTHHLKHFRSLNYIEQNKAFSILAANQQHGWVIAHHKIS